MQCSSCRAVYSNGLEICPRCKTPASLNSTALEEGALLSKHEEKAASDFAADECQTDASQVELTAPAVSTLIEFPGAGRAARPQWRKQLSERVREIQERRAREAEEAARRPQEAPTDEPLAPQLGLVPPPDVPQINPLVAAALRRIERAYQPSASPASRTRGGGGAATAVARFVEDEYQPEQQQRPAPVEAQTSLPKPEKALAEKPSEAAAAHGLVVVAAPAPQTTARTQADKSDAPHRRAAARVIDDAVLEGQETEDAAAIPFVEPYDDRGAVHRRVFAAVVDLLVVAFAASPFAAIIELTNGNWADLRVSASMGGIILIIMFLYLTASTALSGRTWGMSLVSLRPVDAETGLPPTTRQSVLRALLYMGSLITACLGILYALFDAEGRAAHDHLSGTVVVRE